LHWAVNFVLHLDQHLVEMLQLYGAWIYAILFAVIFS
jgi:membrane-associated protein